MELRDLGRYIALLIAASLGDLAWHLIIQERPDDTCTIKSAIFAMGFTLLWAIREGRE